MTEGPRYHTASDLRRLGLTIGRVADVLEEAFRHKAASRAVMPPMTFFHRERAQWFNSMACWIASLGYAGCKFQSGDSTNPARGLGIEDLAAAAEIFRLAGEKQAGTILDPEWS